MLPDHGARGYAIVQGRQIIGSAIAAERGEVAYPWGMYVRPAQQRSGAGSHLLAAVAGDLDPSGDVEVRVLATSYQARDFYRTRGFRTIGEETTEILDGVHAPVLVLRAQVARLLTTLG